MGNFLSTEPAVAAYPAAYHCLVFTAPDGRKTAVPLLPTRNTDSCLSTQSPCPVMDQKLGDFSSLGQFTAITFAVWERGGAGPEFCGWARLEAAPCSTSTTVGDAVWEAVWRDSDTAGAVYAHLAPVLSLLGGFNPREDALKDPYSEDPWPMLTHLGYAVLDAFPVFYSPQGGEWPVVDAANKYVTQLQQQGCFSYCFQKDDGKTFTMGVPGPLPHDLDLARCW